MFNEARPYLADGSGSEAHLLPPSWLQCSLHDAISYASSSHHGLWEDELQKTSETPNINAKNACMPTCACVACSTCVLNTGHSAEWLQVCPTLLCIPSFSLARMPKPLMAEMPFPLIAPARPYAAPLLQGTTFESQKQIDCHHWLLITEENKWCFPFA